jgi:Amt family ammonium transporter
MRIRVYVLFVLRWGLAVYNPIAHWVWGVDGWLRELGALDFVTTNLSAAAAVVAWVLVEIALKNRTSRVGAAAAIVGLVAVTPAAGFVTPLSAVAIGGLAAPVCYAALQLLGRTRLDDRLDVFACHGVGGIVAAQLTGVFATTSVNPAGTDGLLYGNPRLIVSQLIAVLATGRI